MTPADALSELTLLASPATAAGMARFGLATRLRVLGVSIAHMHTLAKRIKKQLTPNDRHALAAALFTSGVYEGQLLACFIDDPAQVTKAQMQQWADAFDNWGVCDTACFHLFDRTPHAWDMAHKWSASPHEFVKRSAFALMASLVVHDKQADDARFLPLLPLIERGAADDRNFVKKGVNWALRCIGKRSPMLNAEAVDLATRLAESDDPAPRWVGKDALRELAGPAVQARLAKKKSKASTKSPSARKAKIGTSKPAPRTPNPAHRKAAPSKPARPSSRTTPPAPSTPRTKTARPSPRRSKSTNR